MRCPDVRIDWRRRKDGILALISRAFSLTQRSPGLGGQNQDRSTGSGFGLYRHLNKVCFLVLILVIATLLGFAPSVRASWEVVSGSAEGLSIVWDGEGARWDTVQSQDQTFLRAIGGGLAATGESLGDVGVYESSAPIALPHDINWTARVVASGVTSGRGQIAPVPTPGGGGDGMAGPLKWLPNSEAYDVTGPVPNIWGEVEELGVVDGVRLARVSVFPVHAMPSSGRWNRAATVTVEIRFSSPAPSSNERVSDLGPVPSAVLNPESAAGWKERRSAKAAQSSSPFTGGNWYRVSIPNKTGMYRLTHAQIVESSPEFGATPVSGLGMYNGGGRSLPRSLLSSRSESLLPVAIGVVDVDGDGSFESGDAIEFFGQAANRWVRVEGAFGFEWIQNPYTEENIYWIKIRDNGAARITLESGTPVGGAASTNIVQALVHQEDDLDNFVENTFDSFRGDAEVSGIDWIWTVLAASDGFNKPSQRVVVRPFGWRGPDLTLDVGILTLDRQPEIELVIDGRAAPVTGTKSHGGYSHSVSATGPADFPDGGQVDFEIFNSSPVSASLDYYELRYNRALTPDDRELWWHLPALLHTGVDEAAVVRLAGVKSAEYRLFDVTDSHDVSEIDLSDGVTKQPNDSLAVGVRQSGLVPRQFMLVANDRWLTPKRVEKKNSSDLRGRSVGTDYVIVTHSDFKEAADKLADWRERSGLRSQVVDVQDIYDEFSWGLFDPTAIRNFVAYARLFWRGGSSLNGPEWLLLFGDGQYDYRNITRFAGVTDNPHPDNWVPPYEDRMISTDDWYAATVPNNLIPTIPVGRIPSRTEEEAMTMVDKIIAYEQVPERGAWQHRAIFLCDDEHNADTGSIHEEYFVSDCEQLAEGGRTNQFLRDDILTEKVYTIEYPLNSQRHKPGARAALLRAWSEGAILVNYVGHGNLVQFAHERVFVVQEDLPKLTNGTKQPILTALTCSAGHFDDAQTEAVAEDVLWSEDGGAIASVAATRLSFNNPNIRFNEQFLKNLFRTKRVMRIGEAFFKAKTWAYYSTPSIRDNAMKYVLLGDPAMTVAMPEMQVNISVTPDTITALAPVSVSGAVTDDVGDTLLDFNGKAIVRLFDTSRHVIYKSAANVPVHYTVDGGTIFRGLFAVTSGLFEAEAVVPADITFGADDARVVAFVFADQADGSGSLEGLPIDRLAADVGADKAGPTISFHRADGRGAIGTRLFSGDPIYPPDPLRVALSDPSGINTTGEIGRAITLTIDDPASGPINLTDRFFYQNSAFEGWADVPLDGMSPGVHRMSVQAWDARNNVAADSLTIDIGQAGAPALADLVAYPNPMSAQSAFTYTLLGVPQGSDAEVTITIYSVAGRLVERLPVQLQRSGPQVVEWSPLRRPANGVYLYRITARDSDTGQSVSKTERLAVIAK